MGTVGNAFSKKVCYSQKHRKPNTERTAAAGDAPQSH